MSFLLYFRRAFFENGRGVLKRGSIVHQIRRMPNLGLKAQYIAIDYAPMVVELIQEFNNKKRDMTKEEKGAVERILDAMTEDYESW